MSGFRSLDAMVDAARRKGPVRIAVAVGHDPDVIEALKQAREMGLAEGTLVGDAARIRALARSVWFDLPESQIIHEPDDNAAVRRAIGLVREGHARLLMKGKVGTATLVRAVLDRESGLRTGRLLSQVIVFQVPGIYRLMLLSDAAINIAPTLEQKAEICRNAIEVAHAIGIEKPNVALLAALEFVNPEMPATVDAAALTVMNRRGQIAGAYLDGPLALDVPLSRFAAERKGIETPLVENTDIFIAPDIEAANILYRAIVYFAQARSGGIVVGARVPLILLSRAETPETKVHSIALAILTAAAQGATTRD
ncbi:MAG: bifunctional enoyl-CoA hydratase/phosphate acetyltransferase [Bryobacterales bacterium]|nr:bifunctional enoyl-CoA hydratase/phosphate acetyltransferase [Bryobacteraceae bacterium]MDW8354413.1 bifunctional enoyl-CoA hydratase/phosphate acetyltransferase [Bryobacterales bacterium]